MLKTVLVLGVFYAQNGVNNETFLLKTHVKTRVLCASSLSSGVFLRTGYSLSSSPGWLFPGWDIPVFPHPGGYSRSC